MNCTKVFYAFPMSTANLHSSPKYLRGDYWSGHRKHSQLAIFTVTGSISPAKYLSLHCTYNYRHCIVLLPPTTTNLYSVIFRQSPEIKPRKLSCDESNNYKCHSTVTTYSLSSFRNCRCCRSRIKIDERFGCQWQKVQRKQTLVLSATAINKKYETKSTKIANLH